MHSALWGWSWIHCRLLETPLSPLWSGGLRRLLQGAGGGGHGPQEAGGFTYVCVYIYMYMYVYIYINIVADSHLEPFLENFS